MRKWSLGALAVLAVLMAGYLWYVANVANPGVMDDLRANPQSDRAARAMILTEDLIGCEPAGELASVSKDEAVRKVTFCPWASMFSEDGGTCRLVMAAMEQGVAGKYGLEIVCEQNMAEGADYCVWKVRRK